MPPIPAQHPTEVGLPVLDGWVGLAANVAHHVEEGAQLHRTREANDVTRYAITCADRRS